MQLFNVNFGTHTHRKVFFYVELNVDVRLLSSDLPKYFFFCSLPLSIVSISAFVSVHNSMFGVRVWLAYGICDNRRINFDCYLSACEINS